MTKEVLDAIRDRRSIRRFKPDTVPYPTITRLLEAARWAPSGGNLQPWHFFVVLDQKTKESSLKSKLCFRCTGCNSCCGKTRHSIKEVRR